MTRLALYFGYGSGGHFLRDPNGWRSTLDPKRDYPGFPWEIGHLGGRLLKNGKVHNNPDGRVRWTCGGRPDLWYAFFWWDRSGDRRPNSNSGFYVRGFALHEPRAAFDFARDAWSAVVERQLFPLQLVV